MPGFSSYRTGGLCTVLSSSRTVHVCRVANLVVFSPDLVVIRSRRLEVTGRPDYRRAPNHSHDESVFEIHEKQLACRQIDLVQYSSSSHLLLLGCLCPSDLEIFLWIFSGLLVSNPSPPFSICHHFFEQYVQPTATLVFTLSRMSLTLSCTVLRNLLKLILHLSKDDGSEDYSSEDGVRYISAAVTSLPSLKAGGLYMHLCSPRTPATCTLTWILEVSMPWLSREAQDGLSGRVASMGSITSDPGVEQVIPPQFLPSPLSTTLSHHHVDKRKEVQNTPQYLPCTLEPRMFVLGLMPQRVVNVTPHRAVWHSLLLSLQVCYWFRVTQGVSNELRSSCEADFTAHMLDVQLNAPAQLCVLCRLRQTTPTEFYTPPSSPRPALANSALLDVHLGVTNTGETIMRETEVNRDEASYTRRRDWGRSGKESAMAFVKDPYKHSSGGSDFGEPWKAEIRMAGPGIEPGSSRMRVLSPAGSLLDFRKWESWRTMPQVGGFSRGSPISTTLSFRRCSILTSINLIGSQTPLLRASQISSLAHSFHQCGSASELLDLLPGNFRPRPKLPLVVAGPHPYLAPAWCQLKVTLALWTGTDDRMG
ncbi:hypothetical protein PR048_022348 [Dryococelus australis]|uniref:Uncharacterized protein n=1 Tax=Dryococelus australis TaxID=614101 RepID=A0ABQ9H0Q9_9NEOP|nr:hypothetical protein PR048_022348 [Dryococelus australis]